MSGEIGFMHPGAMGASIAAACLKPTLWWTEGRSAATAERATAAGMEPVGSIEDLGRRADVIVSVCPPASAVELAELVAATRFDGIYVDVNAIAPSTARHIDGLFDQFVDGGLIGPPVIPGGSTRLYLSGADSAEIAALWSGTALEVRTIDGGAGAASAVKTCFATWTKGTAALLLAIRALARSEGVEEPILAEWATSIPDLAERSELTAWGTAPKAWRFVGEMEEHATAFAAHDLPSGFASAAAEIYRSLAAFKDADGVDLNAVIDALLTAEPEN